MMSAMPKAFNQWRAVAQTARRLARAAYLVMQRIASGTAASAFRRWAALCKVCLQERQEAQRAQAKQAAVNALAGAEAARQADSQAALAARSADAEVAAAAIAQQEEEIARHVESLAAAVVARQLDEDGHKRKLAANAVRRYGRRLCFVRVRSVHTKSAGGSCSLCCRILLRHSAAAFDIWAAAAGERRRQRKGLAALEARVRRQRTRWAFGRWAQHAMWLRARAGEKREAQLAVALAHVEAQSRATARISTALETAQREQAATWRELTATRQELAAKTERLAAGAKAKAKHEAAILEATARVAEGAEAKVAAVEAAATAQVSAVEKKAERRAEKRAEKRIVAAVAAAEAAAEELATAAEAKAAEAEARAVAAERTAERRIAAAERNLSVARDELRRTAAQSSALEGVLESVVRRQLVVAGHPAVPAK